MGLGRKKSHYVSFGEVAKARGPERAETTAFDASHSAPHEADYPGVNGMFDSAAFDQPANLTEFIHPSEPVASADCARLFKSTYSSKSVGYADFDPHFVDDIDEADVEGIEGSYFKERPVSIEEGMRQADETHIRHRKSMLVFVLIAVFLAVGIGLVVFGLSGTSSQNGEPAENVVHTSTHGEGTLDTPSSMTRNYQISKYGEAGVSVYEVMEFSEDGLCNKVTFEATFSNAAAAEEFLADMQDAHENNCVDSYVSGTTGVVVVDVSSLGMTEEEYSGYSEGEVEDQETQEVPEGLTT